MSEHERGWGGLSISKKYYWVWDWASFSFRYHRAKITAEGEKADLADNQFVSQLTSTHSSEHAGAELDDAC